MNYKKMLKEVYSMAKKQNNIDVMLNAARELAYLKHEKQRIRKGK